MNQSLDDITNKDDEEILDDDIEKEQLWSSPLKDNNNNNRLNSSFSSDKSDASFHSIYNSGSLLSSPMKTVQSNLRRGSPVHTLNVVNLSLREKEHMYVKPIEGAHAALEGYLNIFYYFS